MGSWRRGGPAWVHIRCSGYLINDGRNGLRRPESPAESSRSITQYWRRQEGCPPGREWVQGRRLLTLWEPEAQLSLARRWELPPPGGQMRKLRHGDAPSCERERTLRLDLPSTWCAHSASTLRICRRGRERRTPEGGVVRGSGSRRGSAGARLSDFPARSRAAPPTGGPSPSSARPKPQHPRRPGGTPPAPCCLLSGGRSPAAPLRARGEQGRAARPPATIPRPQTRRRDSPKVAERRRRSRHSDPALAPAVAHSHRGPGPGGAASRAPGRARSPRGPGLNFGAQSRGGTRRSLRNRWPEPARPSAAPSPRCPGAPARRALRSAPSTSGSRGGGRRTSGPRGRWRRRESSGTEGRSTALQPGAWSAPPAAAPLGPDSPTSARANRYAALPAPPAACSVGSSSQAPH